MSDDSYTAGKVIYNGDNHKVIWLGWDLSDSGGAVQTNQYLIVHNGKGTLLDPGGVHLFSRVVSAVSRYIDIDRLDKILFSHQDPDVSSGIALWLGITNAEIHLSSLWLRFMPHFGLVDISRIKSIPDKGISINLSNSGQIKIIPSHFLHSPGNFSFYDSISGVLFSGDIGAAVFPAGGEYLFVDNFDDHLKIMEGFHKRYMASGKACKYWVALARQYKIEMIAPQHGAIFPKEQVDEFFTWLSGLECGSDILDEINRD